MFLSFVVVCVCIGIYDVTAAENAHISLFFFLLFLFACNNIQLLRRFPVLVRVWRKIQWQTLLM